MSLNVVVPMAGVGSRFQEAGFSVPKPLIDILGRPMYSWAVDSLPLEYATTLIFVLLDSHDAFSRLKQDILERYAIYRPVVITVPKVTGGQAETVLAARKYTDSATPMLIHNADTAFSIDSSWVVETLNAGVDGALLVFRSCESRWSFVRKNERGRVVEVREKAPISNWASTGTYYFGRGSLFNELAVRQVERGEKEGDEYYVAPLYNEVIARGGAVITHVVDDLYCFGTPFDLENSLRRLAQMPADK